ncbi:MAG: hypothetical protein ACLGHN_14160, partial [Bacteriovoracia bacterium]
SGDQLLSHNTFKQIERKLSEIKKIKKIEGEWANYFPNPFVFEINHDKWTIGDLSLDKQAFYIAHNDEIYLASIEGESHQLTQDESEIAGIKLNELVSSLSRPEKDLKETQLFRFYPDLPLDSVVINATDHLPFELNFEKNATLPPPISGIKVHKDLLGKFYSLLTQLTIKEEVPFKSPPGIKKLAQMKFLGKDTTVNWEVWLKDNKTANAVLVDPVNKRAFSVVGGTLKVFFINLQDYWDKKVIPHEFFTPFTRLNATFIQGEKKAVVEILNREPLAFEAKGFKVDDEKMQKIMQFIFNLGPKDQGERVSLLSNSEKKQLLSGDHLRIEIMGQELILWRKQQELIVVNLTQGYKVHFLLTDENFRASFEDVLK